MTTRAIDWRMYFLSQQGIFLVFTNKYLNSFGGVFLHVTEKGLKARREHHKWSRQAPQALPA